MKTIFLIPNSMKSIDRTAWMKNILNVLNIIFFYEFIGTPQNTSIINGNFLVLQEHLTFKKGNLK